MNGRWMDPDVNLSTRRPVDCCTDWWYVLVLQQGQGDLPVAVSSVDATSDLGCVWLVSTALHA